MQAIILKEVQCVTMNTTSLGVRSVNVPRACAWIIAALTLSVGLYAVLALLQAGSIYDGQRAFVNLRFWGSVAALSLIVSVASGIYAYRFKAR